jgi:hypothetical protein
MRSYQRMRVYVGIYKKSYRRISFFILSRGLLRDKRQCTGDTVLPKPEREVQHDAGEEPGFACR